MYKRIIITAAISGISAVILGAFGAHGLKAVLSSTSLDVWHTAVEYQFYHTLAILFLSPLLRDNGNRLVNAAYYAFLSGIILFSGSLYILASREVHGLAWTSFIGPITPVGGLLFIVGWACLLFAVLKRNHAGT